ncbi:MAG: large conductance mechanosensitive channel protein MscL [Lachnospiraceae bacterium]|nr:large conductance mechanosensitive channel protein MscL [Lachnospiraceae bacterium]
MSKLMDDFKKFAVQGNMLDMAVGMIIGAAFKDIVNSVVNDLIMPVVSMFTGKVDFANMFIALDGNTYATLEDAKAATSVIAYGQFVTQVINFVILAFVIFMMVRGINKLRTAAEKPAEAPAPAAPAEPTEKTCPFCQSTISIKATRCPHCTSELTE